jgi:hypothetical protein
MERDISGLSTGQEGAIRLALALIRIVWARTGNCHCVGELRVLLVVKLDGEFGSK